MARDNLKYPFNRMPKWLLLVGFILIGFPIHIVNGLLTGMRDGLADAEFELGILRDEL